MLFLAGSGALGWGEQKDLCCSSVGGMLDPKGSAMEQRGGERDGQGNAHPWLEFWFPGTGAFVLTPGGAQDNRALPSELWHT